MNSRSLNAFALLLGALMLTTIPTCEAGGALERSTLRGAEKSELRVRSDANQALENGDADGERRLFSFWSILFLLHPGHCGPGPLGHGPHCHDDEDADADADADASEAGDYEESAYESDSSATSSKESSATSTAKSVSWLMLAVAAVAAMAAGIAALVGQRREREERHQLSGSVARRVNLFSAFADNALCGSTERPDRVVEMTASHGDYELH